MNRIQRYELIVAGLATEPMTIDEIAAKIGYSRSMVGADLAALEAAGRVGSTAKKTGRSGRGRPSKVFHVQRVD